MSTRGLRIVRRAKTFVPCASRVILWKRHYSSQATRVSNNNGLGSWLAFTYHCKQYIDLVIILRRSYFWLYPEDPTTPFHHTNRITENSNVQHQPIICHFSLLSTWCCCAKVIPAFHPLDFIDQTLKVVVTSWSGRGRRYSTDSMYAMR